MKKHIFYLFAFVVFTFVLLSCSDKDNDCTKVIQYIGEQLKENALLKSATLKSDKYVLEFEFNTLEIPANLVQNLTTDVDNWKSTLTLINGNTYYFPTIGTSIDKLITTVKVNPSGCNPLSANVAVNLPALGHIKLIVHTKPDGHTPDVEYTFKSVTREQVIPVLGLYPAYDNQVTLIYTDLQGNERGHSNITIHTESLEGLRLPKRIMVTVAKYDHMEPGMNFVNSPGIDEADTSIPYMIDADGYIRWVLDWTKHPDLKFIGIGCGLIRLKNGNYMTGDGNHHKIVEVDIMGKLVNFWDMLSRGYTIHHAISETEDGKILATVSKTTAKLASGKNIRINDFIIKFDPKKGEIIKEWDLVNTLDSARYGITNIGAEVQNPMGQTDSNWAHNNGILEWGDNYLATARYQGIFKFNQNGGLKWIISPHKGWHTKYEKYLLSPLHADGTLITDPEVIAGTKNGTDFEWAWGCHTAVPLPNGHIMVFDNGFGRNFEYDPLHHLKDFYSRGVEYEVNEDAHTVRQVWQYGKERGYTYFAPARSGVQYLKQTGNRLIFPGMGNILSNGEIGARITEIDPKTCEVVFEMELENIIFQRVYRMSLYPDNM